MGSYMVPKRLRRVHRGNAVSVVEDTGLIAVAGIYCLLFPPLTSCLIIGNFRSGSGCTLMVCGRFHTGIVWPTSSDYF